MRGALAALFCYILSACSGLPDALIGDVTRTERQESVSRAYQSPLGFAFEVPSDWQVSSTDGGVLIRRTEAAQNDGFRVLECTGDTLGSCLSNPEMPASLISESSTRLGGLPATEYLFERRTAGATRQWLEYVTVTTKDGKLYAVGAMIPTPSPEIRGQYVSLYRQILQSFRFVK